MKLSNICIWTFGVALLGLVPQPAMGFTLDLFGETESNTIPFYFPVGNYLGESPIDGQEVKINQANSPDGPGGVYYSEDSDTDLTTVEGGNRHIKISTTSGDKDSALVINGAQSSNVLNLTSNTDTVAVGTVVWNGSDSVDFNDLEANAQLGLDLERDGDGDDSIGIEIKYADLGGTLDLTLYDGQDTYTDSQPIPVVTDSTETVYYNFSTYEANNVDINNVQYVSLSLTGPSASDIELNFIETTQEIPFEFSPGLGIIIGGGFLGFNILKNRQKTTQL